MESTEVTLQPLARWYNKLVLAQIALLILTLASVQEAISEETEDLKATLASPSEHKPSIITPEVSNSILRPSEQQVSDSILPSSEQQVSSQILPSSEQQNFRSIDGRTWFSGISALIAILAFSYTVFINKAHKERDARKSLYDELLFREMFFRPFNKKLQEVINDWGNIDTTKKITVRKQTQFLESISNLRDMMPLLALITIDGSDKLQGKLDELEYLISSNPEEEMKARTAIPSIYELLINVQEIMMEKKYKKNEFVSSVIEVT